MVLCYRNQVSVVRDIRVKVLVWDLCFRRTQSPEGGTHVVGGFPRRARSPYLLE